MEKNLFFEELSKELKKTLDSIREAEIYSEYFLTDAYITLTDTIVNLIESIIKGKEPSMKDIFYEPSYIAWHSSLDENIELLSDYTNELEAIFFIDTTKLRQVLEKEKLNIVKSENLFSQEKFEEAIKNIKDATERTHETRMQWQANRKNLVGKAIFKFLGLSVVLWAATITQYDKINSFWLFMTICALESLIILLITKLFRRQVGGSDFSKVNF